MMNWIQHVIPEIKAKDRPLVQRMDACLPYFQEAFKSNSSTRNLGGWMFSSINEYKYAKPFMAALAEHMQSKLSKDEADKILYEVPDLQFTHFRQPLFSLKAVIDNEHVILKGREALTAELAKLFTKRPHDVGVIFNLMTRYETMRYDLESAVKHIQNTLPPEVSSTILDAYIQQRAPLKTFKP